MKRIYVEKRKGFNVQSKNLFCDLKENLKLDKLSDVRIIHRYDLEDMEDDDYEKAKNTIFSERNVDIVYDEEIDFDTKNVINIEFLPGQYDARESFAAECIAIITNKEKPIIKTATLYLIYGEIPEDDYKKIKNYLINPVECREASHEKPKTLEMELGEIQDVEILNGFIDFSDEQLEEFRVKQSLSMTFNDIKLIKEYFLNNEKRNPTITEIKVIDTYWSDHCRHTTFMTTIDEVAVDDKFIVNAIHEYLSARSELKITKPSCLMDLATIGAKYLKKCGHLEDLDVSDEINACSIKIKVDVNGKREDYLLMFKNETHNHPTEIEPFGGAATCLGGAIRDPLSGRSYVYQAMRVTGSGDPREAIEDTIKGKLPQRVITKKAADGYSSYGNQIGLATGGVYEIYDEKYKTKRLEVGGVIGAAPLENVVREKPKEGDVVILLGGRTGRDGIGGATGSSKEHTEESVEKSSSEVQKGNPVTERKIQRLFRNKEVTRLIKKCNDFGAGGVCVAIGELADSLEINLDLVPKKYDGLDGTELAISESQERMAIVTEKENIPLFIKLCEEENLEATVVAKVTNTGKLIMKWRGEEIFSVSREFLDTNGATAETNVKIPPCDLSFFDENEYKYENAKEMLKEVLSDINVCSKKGLAENFDSTIGASTVVMPFGGKNMITEPCGMVSKIPVLNGETTTCSLMTYGYNPKLMQKSCFHGGIYAVIESLAKITALGGNYANARLSFQEYFERMKDEISWGKPFSALLGSFIAQKEICVPAIGGKDSMSGTFKDMTVPETLISFAVTTEKVENILTPEFKKTNSNIVLVEIEKNKNNNVPHFEDLKNKYLRIYSANCKGNILSAKSVTFGGVIATIAKMAMGNGVGFEITDKELNLKMERLGAIVLEVEDLETLYGIPHIVIGKTNKSGKITFVDGEEISLDECIDIYQKPLESVFRTKVDIDKNDLKSSNEENLNIQNGNIENLKNVTYEKGCPIIKKNIVSKPKVFIPVFPGTNCEYDTLKAVEKAGGVGEIFVFRNTLKGDIEFSINEFAKRINSSQMIVIPGGFSAGDEPDGSAKFIASVLRSDKITEAIHDMLYKRDGLMLGICNGFQALIKTGLLPKGEICDITENMPTLTFNEITRHVSCMSRTRICSNLSPWLSGVSVGDTHMVAMSHGEGRFVASKETLKELIENGQIATQYVDDDKNASMLTKYNPNGSSFAVEGITSVDGRIFGKMGHSERISNGIYKNIYGNIDQKIFESGVKYYL